MIAKFPNNHLGVIVITRLKRVMMVWSKTTGVNTCQHVCVLFALPTILRACVLNEFLDRFCINSIRMNVFVIDLSVFIK